MKLKIMTSEAIAYVKENIDLLTDYYKNGEDPEEWIKTKIKKPAFKQIDALEFDDFELFLTDDKPSSTDVENIKIFYTNLKDINDSFASDERLWAGLCHTLFYDYMLKRWPDKLTSKDILKHFFFNCGKPRCYMINTLSKLWWIGRKTYVEESDDHYEILNYMAHDLNGYSFTLFGSNWSNSERSMKLFFEAVFKYEKETNEKVDRQLFNDAMQYMNALCGIYAIDACDDLFISNKVYSYVKERNDYLKVLKKENKEENKRSTGIEKLDKIVEAINNIGGFGSYKEIVRSLEGIYNETLSLAQKNYLTTSLNQYCPDSKEYNGKPLFHCIYVDGERNYKISMDYLYNSNVENINNLTNKNINSRTDYENIIFQIITSIKNAKFSYDDILVYKTQLASLHPEITNIEMFVTKYLESLKTKGIIEKLDKGIYRKSYQIKPKLIS